MLFKLSRKESEAEVNCKKYLLWKHTETVKILLKILKTKNLATYLVGHNTNLCWVRSKFRRISKSLAIIFSFWCQTPWGKLLRFGKYDWKGETMNFCCCCLVTKSCLTLCDPKDLSCQASLTFVSPSLLRFVFTESVMLSNHLPSPSPPAFSLSQHQGLFQWVGSSHQVAKVLNLVSGLVPPMNMHQPHYLLLFLWPKA